MTRFYLRIVVVIFLAFLATLFAFQRLGDLWEDRFFKPKTIQQLHELANTLRDRLDGMDEQQAREALQKIEEESGLPIQVVTLRELERVAAAQPEDENTKRLFIELGGKPFGVMIQADDRLIRRYVKEEERYMVRGLIQLMFIIGLAGIFIVRPLVKKLRAQEATIAKIADGDLSARVDVSPKESLGRLSQRLNSMADRIYPCD